MYQQQMRGVLVGATAKPYDFTDSNGRHAAGVSHTIWLVDPARLAAEPVAVKVSAETYYACVGAGFGAQVEGTADLRANSGRIQARFGDDQAVKVESRQPASAQTAGAGK